MVSPFQLAGRGFFVGYWRFRTVHFSECAVNAVGETPHRRAPWGEPPDDAVDEKLRVAAR
jgi:hypothetical protein